MGRWLLFSLGLFVFIGCSTKRSSSRLGYDYAQNNDVLSPKYVFYHQSLDSTTIFIKLSSKKLLYARKDRTQPYHAKVQVHYRIYEVGNKEAIGSFTKKIEDITNHKENKSIYQKIQIQLPFGKDYLIQMEATDLNRSAIDKKEVSVKKTTKRDRNFVMLIDSETQSPVFENYTTRSQKLLLSSKVNKGTSIFINHYQRDFPLAPPPFSSKTNEKFDYKPDHQEVISFNEKGLMDFEVQNSGFVHFLLDTSQKMGITFFRYTKNYPEIKNVFGMIEPMRYICSKAEYEAIITDENPKEAVDKFWVTKAGSQERAREIIKKYYNRVEDANSAFSSYLEGWKTDRGMISLIFGTPKSVRTTRNQEVWIYGEESNIMSLQFTFTKINNPFSNNDYALQRTSAYKTNWYRAVDAWRSGRVYWVQ